MEKGLHTLDIVIIISFLIICLAIGFYKIPQIKNIRDFAMGRGCISMQMLIATLFATHIGAGSTVGEIEKIYSMGLLFAVVTLTSPLIWLTSCYIYSRRSFIKFKEAGCMTLSDIMEYLYGKKARWITNILTQFKAIALIGMQVLAIGYLLAYYLPITQIQGAIVGFSVLILYSAFGGIRAVIVTDMVQSIILYIGIPAACFAGYYDVGGYDSLIEVLPPEHLSIDLNLNNTFLLFSMFIWSLLPFTSGPFIQRFLMANDSKQIWQVGKILCVLQLPIMIVVIVIAYIIKVKAPDINPNIAFYYLIDHYLPVGVKGLVITGVLAAIMSTADSWLNTTAVVWAHDIVKKIFPKMSDSLEVLVARLSLIIIGLLSIVLIFYNSNSIMSISWLACSLWQPVIEISFFAAILGYKASNQAYIVSVLSGLCASVTTAYYQAIGTNEMLNFTTISIAIGMIASAIGLFGTDFILKKIAVVDVKYKRAR